jgi:hypothetical protein
MARADTQARISASAKTIMLKTITKTAPAIVMAAPIF